MASNDVSKRLTHDYHQTVLRLAHEFSDTKIAWDVSQNVLDKLWDGNVNDSSAADIAEITGTAIHHACQSCGFRLHPGWNGTSLRVKRPNRPSLVKVKKTLKRREQRKRKRATRAEEMKARDNRGRRQNSATSTNTNSSTDISATNPKMVFLRDDSGISRLDRNVLVLTCGRCRNKTNLKGLRREQPQPQKHQQQPQATAGRRPTVATARTPQIGGGVANLSESFERLPRLSSKKPMITKPPNTVNEALSLLQRNKQRKRKTKAISANKNKSGNLLNFLSSLNDH